MEPLAKQLADAQQSGVHELTRRPEEIEQASNQAGLAVFRIDIRNAGDKNAFLNRIAEVLQFPDWFGYNWDALNDCLTDLEWLPHKAGYVLIFENSGRFAAGKKPDFDKAIEVFRSASEYWKGEGRPFWVFLPPDAAPGFKARTGEIRPF
ncbi:MAG TPA: barstar family protein [Terriglobia bacterium]|nr:barstar family protein [Terriglobia bacterium]